MEYSKKDVEQVLEPTDKELNFLNKIEQGTEYPYYQCFGLLNSAIDVENMRISYLRFAETHQILRSSFIKSNSGKYNKLIVSSGEYSFNYHILKDTDKSQTNAVLNQCFSNALKRRYNPEESFLSHLLIFHIEPDVYFYLLSYCTILKDFIKPDLLIKDICGNLAVVSMNEQIKKNKYTTLTCVKHFQDTLGDLPYFSTATYNSKIYDYESLPIDNTLRDLMLEYKKKSPSSLKAVCATIWGIIACKLFDISNTIIGQESNGKNLSVIPYKIDSGKSFPTLLMDVKQQMDDASDYLDCSLSNIAKAYQNDLRQLMPIVLSFTPQIINDSDWEKMKKSLIYQIEPEAITSFAMNITYKLEDNNASISYKYKRELFQDISIYSLHENFINFLKGYLEKTVDPKISAAIIEQGKDINRNRRNVIISKFLESLDVFSSCSKEKIDQIANNSQFFHFSMEDTIMSAGFPTKGLYVIISGKVVVEKANLEGISHPLIVLKEQEIFGFESLAINNIVHNTYRAISDDVAILMIPEGIIKTLVTSNPQVLSELFEIQNKHLERFQKLWLMAD